MIDTIIFDVGMVLAEFCWKEYLESFGFEKEINERIANATVLTDTWNQFDRSEKSDEELLNDFISYEPSLKKEITMFFEQIGRSIRTYKDSNEWIKSLKDRGYKIYILSNYAEKTYIQSKESLTFLDYVDGALFSFQEKVIKPEPKIYQILLERYQINPEHAVFLDDVTKNLEEAKRQGLHTIHVTNREKAKRELELLL